MIRKFLIAAVLALATAAAALPIAPVSQGTKTIACAATTSATALATGVAGQTQLEIQNAGTVAVFVEAGVSTVTAVVATGYPLLPARPR
jgi:hypothetical protein